MHTRSHIIARTCLLRLLPEQIPTQPRSLTATTGVVYGSALLNLSSVDTRLPPDTRSNPYRMILSCYNVGQSSDIPELADGEAHVIKIVTLSNSPSSRER